MMLQSNRLLGGIAALVGAVVWLTAGGIQMPLDSQTLSPQFFPKLLAAGLVILGSLLVILGGGQPLGQVFAKVSLPRNYCLVGCTLLFTLAFGHVDYRLICPVYIAAVLWILGRRKPKDLVLISVTATVILYLLFRFGFMVLLPEVG